MRFRVEGGMRVETSTVLGTYVETPLLTSCVFTKTKNTRTMLRTTFQIK